MNNKNDDPRTAYLLRKSYLLKDQATLAALANGQVTFAIDATYDYIATGWSYWATSTFLVQFSDNERKIMNNFIPNDVFNGWYTGMIAWGNRHFNPFKPKGYLFRAKSNIVVALEDTSNAENTIKIIVDGYRIYREAVV